MCERGWGPKRAIGECGEKWRVERRKKTKTRIG